jgi:hypothetical protein
MIKALVQMYFFTLKLDLADCSVVHLDTDFVVSKTLESIAEWKKINECQKVNCGLRHYWILNSIKSSEESINYELWDSSD